MTTRYKTRTAARTLMMVALIAISATTTRADLLAWWSFNNNANDTDLLNANGDGGNSPANQFRHMLDNNHAFDDGWYDATSTIDGVVPQDPTRDLLLPVQDAFSGSPGALIFTTDPGVGVPSLAGVGARIDVTDLVGDNFTSGTSDNWGSFGGTGDNRPTGTFAGGSLSITGDDNNGRMFILEADLDGNWQDVQVSWANRGTATGYDSRTVAISTDGIDFTEIFSDSGALTSTWTVETALDTLGLLDGATTAYFKFTVDGATSGSGNNRFDNIVLEASPFEGGGPGGDIPEPASAVLLLGLAGAAVLRRRGASTDR